MNSPARTAAKGRLPVGVAVAVLATAGLLSLQAHFRLQAIEGVYFHPWSSETLMQTVSILDLRDEPVRSLWYLHVQPPALDTIRAVLAQLVHSHDAAQLLRQVDQGLYRTWALLFGMTVLLVFWWLSELTSAYFAAVATLLFSVHPAAIFYATLLDSTLLSSLLVLFFCYLLWRIKEGKRVHLAWLVISFLALYLTRSVFQWHWLLLLPFCLLLLRARVQTVVMFFLITSLAVGLYTAKQFYLFGITSTSSFTGLNLCKSIGVEDCWERYSVAPPHQSKPGRDVPRVLSRGTKLNGALNYNNSYYLDANRELSLEYRRQLLAMSPRELVAAVSHNLRIWLRPSSRYTRHVIVDRLPWRRGYDALTSAPALPFILLGACLVWLTRADRSGYSRALGLVVPVLAIIAICVLFERGENLRFKFFVEPVLFCFVASQAYSAGLDVRGRLRSWMRKRQVPHA